ncbi:hypothetical protein O3P69_002758 [Scylla paramamosain]|uniref:Uncharacterized protein n=1 Tax=Scylla paramamosain TaxID=85552 RepID=A0AAW0UME1_SCYPA
MCEIIDSLSLSVPFTPAFRLPGGGHRERTWVSRAPLLETNEATSDPPSTSRGAKIDCLWPRVKGRGGNCITHDPLPGGEGGKERGGEDGGLPAAAREGGRAGVVREPGGWGGAGWRAAGLRQAPSASAQHQPDGHGRCHGSLSAMPVPERPSERRQQVCGATAWETRGSHRLPSAAASHRLTASAHPTRRVDSSYNHFSDSLLPLAPSTALTPPLRLA